MSATSAPGVCPGSGKLLTVLFGATYAIPSARCPECLATVQVYNHNGDWHIGDHERGGQQ